MIDVAGSFLTKALESVAGAESEFSNQRYNNAANRAYYACFQAAVAALMRAGIRPLGANRQWSHAFVSAQFNGELINRRKLYASDLRGVIDRTEIVRVKGDYHGEMISQTEVSRAIRRTRELVTAVQQRGQTTR